MDYLESIRPYEEIIEKFKQEVYKITNEYLFFGIEKTCLDGHFSADDLEKIASSMRKAQAELKRRKDKDGS